MLYPIHVNLAGKRCVVIGAGAVAERKVKSLLACDATIVVIAPQATAKFREWTQEGLVSWIIDYYRVTYLEDAFLVIVATDCTEVNAEAANDAKERQLLVCRADELADGNFTSPSQVTRGDLVLTISTSGNSPTLASVIREILDEEFGSEWEPMTALFGNLRPALQQCGDEAMRKAAVRRVLANEEVWKLLKSGNLSEAEACAKVCL
jgi:precorrin-2 dehydrogenase / sirohydrochlorin ferrochelatase